MVNVSAALQLNTVDALGLYIKWKQLFVALYVSVKMRVACSAEPVTG